MLTSSAIAFAASAALLPDGRFDASVEKIGPRLQEMIAGGESGEVLDFIVHLNISADLGLINPSQDKVARRASVVQSLRNTAVASQRALIQHLHQLSASGTVSDFQPLWIINAVIVSGNRESLTRLAARQDVNLITLNAKLKLVNQDRLTLAPPPQSLPWGLERIRAGHTWEALGINGGGVTVAIVDSGVDWTHPALSGNYRGTNSEGNATHSGNWYDTVSNSEAPHDPLGHGTHVAGIAVGQNSIGVAPGARWIAARVLDEHGNGTIGDIHLAFQWLLAPDGDPSLSPDVINNSWAGPPGLLDFIPDTEALRAAGIIAIFAAGNAGPGAGSIGAPANYPDTIAIGASDDLDSVAWFSSRGPSDLTDQLKPTFTAPGARILSSLPGNAYGYLDGTSMATPHASGAYALLLSADPALGEDRLTQIISTTAQPLGVPSPGGDGGWGRIDIYAAASTKVTAGELRGLVSTHGQALPGVAITITTPSSVPLVYHSDDEGKYQAALVPGAYSLTIAPFGFQPYTVTSLIVSSGQAVVHDPNLSRLPGGRIQGLVIDSETLTPLDGTIYASGTPVSADTGAGGQYSLRLPVGQYEIVAEAMGHRLGRATVSLQANRTELMDYHLDPGPKNLLVDSGRWYYRSQIGYFADALTENDFSFDLWSVQNPLTGAPSPELLSRYDAVIWSSPLDSPAQIGAGTAISSFLGGGGNLLISGQNVAEYSQDVIPPQFWWYAQVRGRYLGQAENPDQISGTVGTPFQGLSLNLSGPDSADNQASPDSVIPQTGALTGAAFSYGDGRVAGLLAGHCETFQAVHLGFGLEGVNKPSDRAAIVAGSYEFFARPKTTVGIGFSPSEIDELVPSSAMRSYIIEVLNLSEILTDTIRLSIEGASWPSELITQTLTLGSCSSGTTALSIAVPADLPPNTSEEFWIVAQSSNSASYSRRYRINLKTPDYILLVDDDRWYDQEPTFRAAMENAGFSYDFWETAPSDRERGGPPFELLSQYPMVVWYTGFDWFAPITDDENETLERYLELGGRLFLTSQDYLYHHNEDPLAYRYFGVRQYRESVTPTLAYLDGALAPLQNVPIPAELDYGRYVNYSDGLIPDQHSGVALWHDRGMAGGLANTNGVWRTLFWALPFESLPVEQQAPVLKSTVGWLSDLGDSTFEVDRRSGPDSGPGMIRTYTLTLRSQAGSPLHQVKITNTLPAQLEIDPESLSGGAVYNPEDREITWQGAIAGGQRHIISYQARPVSAIEAGRRIDNPVSIYYQEHNLRFDRLASFWINAPDLSESILRSAPLVPDPVEIITYELDLYNQGLDAEMISATLLLPDELVPITSTLRAESGRARLDDHTVVWRGAIQSGQATTIALSLTTRTITESLWLPSTVVIHDGITDDLVRDSLVLARSHKNYFPFVSVK